MYPTRIFEPKSQRAISASKFSSQKRAKTLESWANSAPGKNAKIARETWRTAVVNTVR
jgi:hypothetical protein